MGRLPVRSHPTVGQEFIVRDSHGVKEFWKAVRRMPTNELHVLAGLLAVALALWGFFELADEVVEGQTQLLDEQIMQMFRSNTDPKQPIGPPWLTQVARDLTALGGYSILTFVVVAVVGFCALMRRFDTLWLVLAVSIGGGLLTVLLKNYFSRQRPDVVPHLVEAELSSFPSGHAMASAMIYLALAAVVVPIIPTRLGRSYVIAVAVFMTILVGVSRVYLGVHYPSDVLGGWTVGLSWAIFCWLIAWYFHYRRTASTGAKISRSQQ